MNDSDVRDERQLPIVFWFIWLSILIGLFVMHEMLAPKGNPWLADNPEIPIGYAAIAVVGCVISLAVRFLVIPRIRDGRNRLTAMVVGLALAEGVGIIGIFVVPTELNQAKFWLFAASVACVVLSAPLYARIPWMSDGGQTPSP